jgi:hypothetical protein
MHKAAPSGQEQRRAGMDVGTATQVLDRAFQRDIEDGTLEVRREDGAVMVDGIGQR